MTTLTRAQLAALTTLHRDGALPVNPRTATGTGPTRRALFAADLARIGVGGTVRPAVHAWADGFGRWHVIVPDGIDNASAVARAIIRGEVAARAGGVPRWRIDLHNVSPTEWREA